MKSASIMKTRHAAVPLVVLLAAACGASGADAANAAGTSDALQSAAASSAPPVPSEPPVAPTSIGGIDLGKPAVMLHGTNPPPASPEAIQKAQECSRLQSEAGFEWRAAVNALETDQCGKDADCDPWALYTSDYPAYMERTFQSDRDACWASCSATPGAPEYAGALRDIAARACADFRAAGCPVYPAGCVPVEPVALTCVDGVCQP